MKRNIAWVQGGVIREIIELRSQDIVRGEHGDGSQLIDITGRPDLKVGSKYPEDFVMTEEVRKKFDSWRKRG